jgi:hypothetical protein
LPRNSRRAIAATIAISDDRDRPTGGAHGDQRGHGHRTRRFHIADMPAGLWRYSQTSRARQVAPPAHDSRVMTFPGPSRRIVVQPLEQPAPKTEPGHEPVPVEPEPARTPEREDQPEPVAP